MAEAHPRVVTLIASATETVNGLGALDLIVGRSHECDFPPEIAAVPQLTRAKFDVNGSSGEIDQRVKALVEQGLAVYEVDAAQLKELAPDVILTQDQCEVCAVSLGDVEAAVCDWVGHSAELVSLKPHCLDDIYADTLRIGAALGREAAGQALVERMKQRIHDVKEQVSGRLPPRVAFVEWIDPPMSGGHWFPEIVAAANGVSLFGEVGAPSPWISLEQIVEADPDVIVVGPCGYGIDKTRREMAVLDDNPAWQGLRAVKSGQVWLTDGNHFFNRPGPRLVESVEILAEILHPGTADYGHAGMNFVRHEVS
jgi:iron complex transport system substrate-binding protein